MLRLPSAWLILAGSLLLTVIGWNTVQDEEQETVHTQFVARSSDVVARIEQRMQAYEYVLRGAAALFGIGEMVDHTIWHDYVASLKLHEYMNGIQGVGFAPLISQEEKASLVARVRKEGFPSFSITPPGQRSAYTPVIYLEPFSGPNLRAFGYDMFSDPARREAMERARDSGEISVSSKVTLVQEEGEKKQAGFLMFLPVYRIGQPRDTPDEKRAALLGYVYAPFRMDDLMEGIVGRSIPDLDVHIYDGDARNASSLMFDSLVEKIDQRKNQPLFTNTTRILVGGHQWLVQAASLPSFEKNGRGKLSRIVLILGVFISLLLFFIARTQDRYRKRAMTLAENMTAAFNESEMQMKAILDNSPYIAWLKDVHGRYLRVNQRYVEYSGLKAEDILGKTDLDLWPKAYADKYLLDDAEVIASRKPKHVEEQTSDGIESHWMETFKTPVFDANGDLTATVGFAHDISERKLRELQIIRLSQVYSLLSRVNEAIVRAQDRHALFGDICKAAVESELARLIWIGVLDEERQAVIPIAYAGVEEGYTKKLNIRLDDERTGNGPLGIMMRTGVQAICDDIENDPRMELWRDEALRRGYRSSAGFPIREQGVIMGAINIYSGEVAFFTQDILQVMLEMADDVSYALDALAEKKRRERAEEEVRQINLDLERRVQERTRQMEEANKELESFSYSVSHDLRAPLRSIDGFSQILAKKYHDLLDETGRDYLDRVRNATQRMGYLIDDLLRLARVARSQLERKEIDLGEIAEQVADELRKSDPLRQVDFVFQQGLSAYADPGLMRIVLVNLLGNAYKFTGKKPEASIEFGRCDVAGEQAFFVRDNGVGFNMAYAQKLFGAFQRLHGASEFPGTGIGLATVQRIIHRHHGRVWAEAKEGVGAAFYFTLPQRIQDR